MQALESIREARNKTSVDPILSTLIIYTHAEALGQALLTLIRSREQDEFRSIFWILHSSARQGASVKTDPSANHKLKWTLRAVTDIDIPEKDGPETEAKKDEALMLGIKKIEEFGRGTGYFETDGSPAKRSVSFLEIFYTLLEENGVHSK